MINIETVQNNYFTVKKHITKRIRTLKLHFNEIEFRLNLSNSFLIDIDFFRNFAFFLYDLR